jgi:hypothetical protein
VITTDQLVSEVNDPDWPWVGPYLKSRFAEDLGLENYDCAPEIEEMLAAFGVEVNEDGYATWAGVSDDAADSTADDLLDEQPLLRGVANIILVCSALAWDCDDYFVPVRPGFPGECVLLARFNDRDDAEELARGTYDECESAL